MDLIYPAHAGEAQLARLQQAYARQRAAQAQAPYPALATRKHHLLQLEKLLLDNQQRIADAIRADFGNRSAHETRLLEIFPSVEGLRHARKHLQRWSRARSRPVALWFQPARARVMPQPLGVVGIIVPWNYPIFLAVGPLTAALAAGNRAVVKMSEFTPHTGELFASLINEYFDEQTICVINGGADVAVEFSKLAWDHLLFTGSTGVGRHVMRAAAENLTPVTLELGGKSPTIIGPDYPIDAAAASILYGKCLNAGQTCVAPDYVLLPEGKADAFLDAARSAVAKLYPTMATNGDYTAIINQRHLQRLRGYLAEAAEQGAHVVPLSPLGENLDSCGKLAPTLVFNPGEATQLMRDEIFGPILPVLTYRTLDQAIAFVNARPRPLALYYFERDSARIEQMMHQTIAGGVSINDVILHVAQHDLPFGGVGPSGIGHYHGKEGFDTFSKLKPVFMQSRINGVGLLKPPYGRLFQLMLRLMLR